MCSAYDDATPAAHLSLRQRDGGHAGDHENLADHCEDQASGRAVQRRCCGAAEAQGTEHDPRQAEAPLEAVALDDCLARVARADEPAGETVTPQPALDFDRSGEQCHQGQAEAEDAEAEDLPASTSGLRQHGEHDGDDAEGQRCQADDVVPEAIDEPHRHGRQSRNELHGSPFYLDDPDFEVAK